MNTIVIASPHSRHNDIVAGIQASLTDYQVIRIFRQEDLTREYINTLSPQWIFFPHWSWIIPQEIYENFECVIFHMTDLPYGRGGSPLQNLIVRGYKITQLSAIKCVEQIDAGPIYKKITLSLLGTAEEILQRASLLIREMIVSIVKNAPVPTPQLGEVVVFKRRQHKDGDVSKLSDLEEIYDFIRMLDGKGYPPAFISTQNLVFEFNEATLIEDCVEAKVSIRKRSENE
jgi:methionyl-tRNA formyltransferase